MVHTRWYGRKGVDNNDLCCFSKYNFPNQNTRKTITGAYDVYVMVDILWGEPEIMDNDSSLPTIILPLTEHATCTRTEDRTKHTIFHLV